MHRLLRWLPAFLLLPFMLQAFLPEPPEPVVIPAAFRWRNSSWLDGAESQAIETNGLQRVYLKLLDIDWNSAHGAHPISSARVPHQWRSSWGYPGNWKDKVELVPSIYITNGTFLKLSDAEVAELATKLLRKLRMECPETIHGVLLDCDWTEKTRKPFFHLTRIMNDSLDVPLTVTIRLHQYAQPAKTGVPPADRGMLMPYNVGRLTAPGTSNSIFNEATAAPYFTSNEPYPLPLDIGLPAFSWGVQFRKGTFLGILREEEVDRAIDLGLVTGRSGGLLQVVNEDNDQMPALHLGDEIRVEKITPQVLKQVAGLASQAVNSDTLAVAYFETGTHNFQGYSRAVVRDGFTRFGRLRTSPFFDNGAIMEEAEVKIDTMWIVPDTTLLEPVMDSTR